MSLIHVSREGLEIGQFTEEQFRENIFAGRIQPEDHYWIDGFVDWRPVGTYRARARTHRILSAREAPQPVPQQKPAVTKPLQELDGWIVGGLAAAAFVPVVFPLFFLISIGIVLAVFVLAIMLIVKGRALFGALLIATCPFVMMLAFAMLSIGIQPGTLQEKIERTAREGRGGR